MSEGSFFDQVEEEDTNEMYDEDSPLEESQDEILDPVVMYAPSKVLPLSPLDVFGGKFGDMTIRNTPVEKGAPLRWAAEEFDSAVSIHQPAIKADPPHDWAKRPTEAMPTEHNHDKLPPEAYQAATRPPEPEAPVTEQPSEETADGGSFFDQF